MAKEIMCKHCRRYFIGLKRTCTINLFGECDCPLCQGMCECEGLLSALDDQFCATEEK